MAMNKQRKMLISVLCLGLGSLAVDRFVIGMPDTASAAEDPIEIAPRAPTQSEPNPAAQPQTTTNPTTAKALPSYARLTQRLTQAQAAHAEDQSAAREDPFSLPADWQPARTTPIAEQTQAPQSEQHARLTSLFKLDGTVRSLIDDKEEMLAVISGGGVDGRAIRVGQKISVPLSDGNRSEFKLVEVGQRYVVWELSATQEQIKMQVEEDL